MRLLCGCGRRWRRAGQTLFRLSPSGAVTLTAIDDSGAADYFFGPVVQFSSFDQTTEQAVVAARETNARRAPTQWRNTVLTAVLEVENALVPYEADDRALGSTMRASQLYGETLALTHDLYQPGDTTLGNMIDAEQAFAEAEADLAALHRQATLQFIKLNTSICAGSKAGRPDGWPIHLFIDYFPFKGNSILLPQLHTTCGHNLGET